MIKLERMTTEYIDFEDRIRLSCAVADAPPIVVWLTQRLLQRLLPPLLQWLERQGQPTSDVQRSDLPRSEAARAEVPRADILQSFAQQAARAEAKPQPRVRVAPDSAAWLARSVDLTQFDRAVRLTFRGTAEQEAMLLLSSKLLRQWLGIVHDAYVKAAWPLDVWPDWVRESVPPVQHAVVLH